MTDRPNGGSGPPLDRHRVAAARLWAAHRYPYLASAVFASPVVPVEGLGGASADDSWRVYVDPVVVDAWSAEQLGSVMVHLVGHLLRDHGERAREAGVEDDSRSRWVDAADAEINDDLVELHFPGPPVLPRDLGCEPGQLAEHYFANGHEREGERWGCGSAAHGQHGGHEQAPADADETRRRAKGDGEDKGEDGQDDDPGLGGEARRLLRRQVANEVLAHGKQAGDVPQSLQRWASEVTESRVDWRRALAAELRGLSDVAGRVDYSYRRPSRRSSISPDVVLPSLRRPVPEVAIICDTSASMDAGLLGRALAEVDGLLRSVGVGPGGMRVLACDTAVQAARRVTSARDVELLGGGGTDMGVAIEAAARLRPRPGVVVVLTDGETPWPAAPPPAMTVVVGLLKNHSSSHGTIYGNLGGGGTSWGSGGWGQAPAWARSVRIEQAG